MRAAIRKKIEAAKTADHEPISGIRPRLELVPPTPSPTPRSARTAPTVQAFEQHYRIRDIAALWGLSDRTVINLFKNEPVFQLGTGSYYTRSIPASVVQRVYESHVRRPELEIVKNASKLRKPLEPLKLKDLREQSSQFQKTA